MKRTLGNFSSALIESLEFLAKGTDIVVKMVASMPGS